MGAVQADGVVLVDGAIDSRTVMGIIKERQRGRSWAQIAKRYVLGSAEDAERIVRRWLYVNDITIK